MGEHWETNDGWDETGEVYDPRHYVVCKPEDAVVETVVTGPNYWRNRTTVNAESLYEATAAAHALKRSVREWKAESVENARKLAAGEIKPLNWLERVVLRRRAPDPHIASSRHRTRALRAVSANARTRIEGNMTLWYEEHDDNHSIEGYSQRSAYEMANDILDGYAVLEQITPSKKPGYNDHAYIPLTRDMLPVVLTKFV